MRWGPNRRCADTLRYLIATQLEDGHWYQNQWLGGRAFWQGVQLDETAFPVLLAAMLDERVAFAAFGMPGLPWRDVLLQHAPGRPGIAPTWTSSAKDMVGCALGISRLW